MKTKKIGVFAALTVVLLVSAALIASCVDALGSGGIVQKEKKTYIPPMPRAIGFMIEVEAFESARYSGPNKSEFNTLSSFDKIDAYISGGDGGTYSGIDWNGSGSITVGESPIVAGDPVPYKVEVIGYNDEGVAVAYGKADPEVVVTSAGGTAHITMREIRAGDHTTVTPGDGTLAFAVTDSIADGGADSITVNVYSLQGGTDIDDDDPVTNALTYPLPSGFYRLELIVEKDEFQTTIYRELVEIWSGMTTTYTKTLTSLVSNVHVVTYNFNDGRTPAGDRTATVKYDHADTFLSIADKDDTPGSATANEPSYYNGTTADTGRTFKGWFSSSDPDDANLVKYTVDTYKVIRPITVYAQWGGAAITLNVTITYSSTGAKGVIFVVTDNDNSNAVIPAGSYETWTQDDKPNLRITANVPTANGTVSYDWSYEFNDTSLGTSDFINVDFSGDVYSLIGNHVFKVMGTDAGLPASDPAIPPAGFEGTVTITITAP
jgi:hypothetical protein